MGMQGMQNWLAPDLSQRWSQGRFLSNMRDTITTGGERSSIAALQNALNALADKHVAHDVTMPAAVVVAELVADEEHGHPAREAAALSIGIPMRTIGTPVGSALPPTVPLNSTSGQAVSSA